MGSNRGLNKKFKVNLGVNQYTPVPNKAAHSNFIFNNMSSIRFKDETPSKVTTNRMDDPSDPDNDTEQELEDSSSVEDQKVTAVIAVIDTSTEDPTNGIEHSRRCRRTKKLLFTKKIRVLLDTGSDGDIWFHRKGATKRFPYTERQVVKSYHTSAGVFHTKGQAKFEMKFFEYSESKHYTIRPDVLEYDRLERPAFDLIIGVKTMKRLGIVLDFQTNNIQIDHISLPMRDIFKLQDKSKIDKAWAVNNSIMRDEPESTKELTDRAVKILDAK